METQTKEKKEYVSLRFAHGDIEEAIRLLNRAKTETDTEIQFVIVKYCIIAYARPFTFTKPKDVSGKMFIPLEKSSVFPGGNPFHKQLIDDRNQYIAHGDLKAYNPKLYYQPERGSFTIGLTPSHLYDDIGTLMNRMLAVCEIVLKHVVDRMTTLKPLLREEFENNRA